MFRECKVINFLEFIPLIVSVRTVTIMLPSRALRMMVSKVAHLKNTHEPSTCNLGHLKAALLICLLCCLLLISLGSVLLKHSLTFFRYPFFRLILVIGTFAECTLEASFSCYSFFFLVPGSNPLLVS